MVRIWFADRLFGHTMELKQNKGGPAGLEEAAARELSCMCCRWSIWDQQCDLFGHFWLHSSRSIGGLLCCWSGSLTSTCVILRYFSADFRISEKRPRCRFKCEIELFHLYVAKKKNTYCKTGVEFSISTLQHTLQMVAPNILPASWINYFTPRCQTVLQWARLYFCHLNFWAHFHANGKFIVTNRVTLAVTPYLNEYQVRLYFPAAIAH